MMTMFPMRISPGLPVFGDDMRLVKNGLRKLLDLGAKTIYPAHGRPFSAELLVRSLE